MAIRFTSRSPDFFRVWRALAWCPPPYRIGRTENDREGWIAVKGYIRAEIFGDDVRQKFKLAHNIFNDAAPGAGIGDKEFGIPSNTWCAEITGLDSKYKYQRCFLHGKKDYTHANGKGSRGMYYEWVLESGHIYEVKEQTSWSHCERFFCTVSDEGNIINLSEGELIKMLKKPVGEMTDDELLNLVDCPEEDIQKHVSERATGIPASRMNAPEMADIILWELERRHGEGEAEAIWNNRFGDNDA